ncbi:phage tail protein [Caldanaerobius polysaccharolyticus]|uniref:phage tail protein n=1 Tax=Caldanaerobius polysaccharolyticus TaxID=44256 RepID=UPI00047906B3|nr:phage tail protein [Caldanaerobius polysaccharolyticus]
MRDVPIVLDKDLKRIAYLENAFNVKVTEQINGDYAFSMNLPRNDPKWQYIQYGNYVEIKGQYFMINYFDEERDEENKLIGTIEGKHIYFELLGEYWEEDREEFNFIPATTPQVVLNMLISGTRFTIERVDEFSVSDIRLERGDIHHNILKVIEVWCGELKRDNFNISLLHNIGQDNGIQFRYKKNIKTIKKITDGRDVVTRLYVYGKDGLTFESITGQKYIDSQYIGNYSRPKIGEVKFDDIDDPQKLLDEAQKYLAKVEVPKVSYDVNVVELSKLTGYEYEKFNLGDIITIIDEELGIDVKAEILEYTYYPFEPQRSSVVLGNFIPKLTDYFVSFQKTQNIVETAFNSETKKLSTKWLEGIIDTHNNELQAGLGTVVANDQGLLILDNKDNPTKAIALVGGMLAIANQKDANGNWIWRTFGTGDGFTADVINTGQLNTSLVRVISEENNLYIDSTGLYVTDENNNIRVRLGQYIQGKYGLEIKDATGQRTILDQDGILQTWQDSIVDNLDSSHPMQLKFYLPPETLSVRKCRLNISLESFRAYEKGAAAFGGWGVTSGPSSKSTSGAYSDILNPSWVDATSYNNDPSIGGTTGNGTITNTSGSHDHSYTFHGHNHLVKINGASVYTEYGQVNATITVTSDGDHTHTIPAHMHLIPDHTHNIEHTHQISIGSHSHDILYGIYTATKPTNVSVKLDGTVIVSDINTDQTDIDIPVNSNGWHTIEISSTTLGRINASLFIQAFMSV